MKLEPTFRGLFGNKRLDREIGLGELLRLINGGARMENVRLVTTPPTSQSDEALVEELAQMICRGGGHGLCVGFCHTKRCADAIELYSDTARAILPIITAREASARAEGRREGIEEAAKVMENLCFFTDIDEQLAMTKQDMSVRTCHEGAKAIRALAEKQP